VRWTSQIGYELSLFVAWSFPDGEVLMALRAWAIKAELPRDSLLESVRISQEGVWPWPQPESQIVVSIRRRRYSRMWRCRLNCHYVVDAILDSAKTGEDNTTHARAEEERDGTIKEEDSEAGP
jgi:hypothetical protein